MNIHTRTPYPTSDVRMVKGLQEYINKTRSLIIAHATTSTNQKILIPSGSVDMREFETKWSQPGVAIEVDFDQGPPQQVAPTPLPNELYANEKEAKNDIDHQLGLYEMMMGNAQAAPQTSDEGTWPRDAGEIRCEEGVRRPNVTQTQSKARKKTNETKNKEK
mgnify:CR=1 FL=1